MSDCNSEFKKILLEFNNSTLVNSIEEEFLKKIVSLNLISSDSDYEAWVSEKLAFQFMANASNSEIGWGLFYGPAYKGPEGKLIPDVSQISPQIIQYWINRYEEVDNILFKVRYIGLACVFHKIVIGKQASQLIIKKYLNSSVVLIEQRLYRSYLIIDRLDHLLSVSINNKLTEYIEKFKTAIIDYEKEVVANNERYSIGFSYDLLFFNKRVELYEHERKHIIDTLENNFSSLILDLKASGPWSIEKTVHRLAEYYRKEENLAKERLMLLQLKDAYYKLVDNEPTGFRAAKWLESLLKIFMTYNVKDQIPDILTKINHQNIKASGEMSLVKWSSEYPRNLVDKYVESRILNTEEESLKEIVQSFIPSIENTVLQILTESKVNPFNYLFSTRMYKAGQVVATIRPLEESLDDLLVEETSKRMIEISFLLNLTLKSFFENFSVDESLVDTYFINQDVFKKTRIGIIKKGFKFYLEGDFESSMHLLIPQLEQALRNLLADAGGNIFKKTKHGGYLVKNLEDIVNDAIISQILGPDFCFYLKVLYTDQRGWNLRNDLCHGLINHNRFNATNMDRVIHSLISISLIRKE